MAERTRQLQVQQALLYQMRSQVPASIATFVGSEHEYPFFNNHYQQLSGNRTCLGPTVAEQAKL